MTDMKTSRIDEEESAEQEQQVQTHTCPIHGHYEAKRLVYYSPGDANIPRRTIWSGCPTCAEESRGKQAKIERDNEKQKIERNRANALIPKRFAGKQLSNFQTETPSQNKAWDYAHRYLGSWAERLKEGDSLILYGNTGTGKTHLACGVANGVIDLGSTALYVTAYDLVRAVKSSWQRGAEKTETEIIKSFLSPDLLIVDEVGVQFGSDAEKLVLFDVINKRYADMRPMILISNLRLDDIEGYLGSRVVDRFYEGKSRAVPFTDASWRRRRGG